MKRKDGQQLIVTVTEDVNLLQTLGRVECDRVCLIKRNDLPAEMMELAAITTIKAIERYGEESEDYCGMARVIKEEFNVRYGLTWHCLLLVRGGSSLTHKANGYICLEYGPFLVTLF